MQIFSSQHFKPVNILLIDLLVIVMSLLFSQPYLYRITTRIDCVALCFVNLLLFKSLALLFPLIRVLVLHLFPQKN